MSEELNTPTDEHLNKRIPLPLLEDFLNNDKNVPPEERTSYVLGVCMGGIVCELTMDTLKEEPFSNRKDLRPTKKLLILELKRRSSSFRNLTNKSVRSLIDYLEKSKDFLSDLDIQFLKRRHCTLVYLLKE